MTLPEFDLGGLNLFLSQPSGVPGDGNECRGAARIEFPFPATVRGVDASGARFVCATVVDSLSACGLDVRLQHPVALGTRLLAVIRLSATMDDDVAAPYIAVRGRVVRTESCVDGRCGVAMTFTHRRFLYAPAS